MELRTVAIAGSITLHMILLLLCCSSAAENGCGQICKITGDCPQPLVCFPEPMQSGNRTRRTGICGNNPQFQGAETCNSSNTSCKPSTSVLYNDTQKCPECCGQGLAYSFYSCSPPLQQLNDAVLSSTSFTTASSGSSISAFKCASSQTSFSDTDRVVSIASGWFYSDQTLCLKNINISAPNNRSVVAKIIAECSSTTGCNSSSSYLEPCAPNSVAGTQAIWNDLGYASQNGLLQVKWSLVNLTGQELVPSITVRNKSTGQGIVLGASTAGAALSLVILALGISICCRYKAKAALNNRQFLSDMGLDLLPQEFSYHVLQKATGNFSASSKLGEGGFGSVFKGRLSDGSLVAVKRMDVGLDSSNKGSNQFKAEVMSIGSIHHLNLVKLRGFCMQPPVYLLVYEFMPNGSLDKWLFKQNEERFLDWPSRLSVAVDVARGLAYLHEGCRERVLHLDIKPHNILLDENMRAKISDFGLARFTERGKSHVMTAMRGTPGYMAPEWLHITVTDKTDVYSFGIFLLELLCSKSTLEIMQLAANSSEVKMLGDMVPEMAMAGKFVDGRLLLDSNFDSDKFVKIGLWCIQDDPKVRPPMKNVVDWLEEIVQHVPDLPLSSFVDEWQIASLSSDTQYSASSISKA